MKNPSRTEALLAQATVVAPKTKASFNLDAAGYEAFRTFASAKNLSQSVIIDALLADLLERFTADGFQVAAVVPAKKTRGRPKAELS